MILLDPEDEHLRSRVYIASTGYVLIRVSGKKLLLHRYLMRAPRGKVVDHLNGDRLDCRKANLEVTTQKLNNRNTALRSDNKSGFKGVYFCKAKGKWRSMFEKKHIGWHDSAEDANLTRLTVEKRAWGIKPRRLADFIAAGLA